MTNKQEADTYWKGQRLERYGFDADPNRVRIHKTETPLHICARFLCGYVLQSADRAWDVECIVTDSGDRVDVLDFGEFDEEPRAIEFESNPDRKTVRSKATRYAIEGPLSDVLVLDLRECPERVDEIPEWIRSELGGV